MKSLFIRLARSEEGQDLIEYGLLAAFVALVAAVGASALGGGLSGWYSAMAGTVSGWRTSP